MNSVMLENHGNTDWMMLEGTPEVIWSVIWSDLPGTCQLPGQAESPREGLPGPCPDSFWISPRMATLLCWWLVTLTVRKDFLIFTWNILCFSLCPLPLVLSLGTTEKSLPSPSLHSVLGYLCLLTRSLLRLLQAEQSQLSVPFLISEIFQTFNCLSNSL